MQAAESIRDHETITEVPPSEYEVARAVALGLGANRKRLPSWLLYDTAGSALFERITTVPEYYLARAEAEILSRRADWLVSFAARGSRISLAELGAGTATKTEVILGAAVRAQGSCVYLACDISAAPLCTARQRLRSRLPLVDVRLAVGTHVDAGPAIAALEHRQVLLWIGSSIGNCTDAEAVELLVQMRAYLRSDAVLMFSTDLIKSPEVLLRAYDDARGVTAAFSKNLLVRINRELDARFDLDGFQHVAEWRPDLSNIEIYLESRGVQDVWIGALGRHYAFRRGERIHTETCAKYDAARIDRILHGAGFARIASQLDTRGQLAVHVARAA